MMFGDEMQEDKTDSNESEVAAKEDDEVRGEGIAQDEEGKAKSEVSGVLIMNENNKKADQMEDAVEIDRKNATGKGEGDSDEDECVPPALPPRPPPRARQMPSCTCEFGLGDDEFQRSFQRSPSRSCWASGLRKYVFLCTACGSLSILLGTLFLTVYFMLKSYTSSLNHFETIPTYVPSGMLIATGFLIICLACRKNRNSFLMKLCGLCSLCCAVLCVSVTVTTTVIHMNRLQTLRECLYTQKTQSCTCYSVLMDNDRTSDEGIKFVFNSTPDCEVVHGALYSCLRAIFGLSVIGILVCIFSCMLVYQLLSHEKKKMYWAQLEMRCRYLYRQQRNPHYCSCCDECRYPPPPHEIFPWELMGNRFWSSGRIGNLYTPNPEDRDSNSRLRSGWNWRRLPWNRSGSTANEPTRANLSSPDSQYGFSSTPTVDGAPYTVLDPRTTNCTTGVSPGTDITEGGFYSWGPPPPYASNRNSANNSPARRSLGEILHQVSPIRRNDNVSPIRPYHHVHHHHMHHQHSVNHPCTSSGRQVPSSNAANQPNCLQKSAPSRIMQVAEVQQSQPQQNRSVLDNLRSNSLTSVPQFQKLDQNKDNYENTYESESFSSANGFNTLPSLKKRNQSRASDLFQNEGTSAYYFSSVENLGCSDGNAGNERQFQNENFPPRVFLMSETPRGSVLRYGGNDASGFQNHQLKAHSDSEHQIDLTTTRIADENSLMSPQSSSRGPRVPEGGNSFVKKLFVSCSPTKQKLRIDGEGQGTNGESRDPAQMNKKKIGKRQPPSVEMDSGNENVITFHYRLGIPRSPNIQNFSQISDKSLKACENAKDDCGTKQWSNYNANESEEPQENQKALKGFKYTSKDVELLQKHGSLMKEFNKNMDLQKNLKLKYEKSSGRSSALGGVDNKGFQNAEDCGRSQFPRPIQTHHHTTNQDYRESKPSRMEFNQNELEQNEDYPAGNLKNENESDVYFGDISNSSCYVSVQNEGADSSLYEEAVESRRGTPVFPSSGQSLLNKQNLKRIEDESSGFNEMDYDHSELEDSQTYSKLQGGLNYQQGYRNRSGRQFRYNAEPETKKDEVRPGPSDFQQPRRPFLVSNYNEPDNKSKYFSSPGCYQDHYRPPEPYQEASNSNDEHSSSSLTVDSGISTSRNYLPRCYETAYQEVDCLGKANADSLDCKTDPGFETLNERFTNIDKFQPCKISNLDNLSDFSHPLFQKPKVLPRSNRYKEVDASRQKKASKMEFDKEADADADSSRKPRNSFSPKVKPADDGQFVNLNLSNESEVKAGEEIYPKQKAEETLGKSPKPLPRTTVVSGDGSHAKHGKYPQTKEKHFLAPDAQYEYKSDFKQKTQSKKSDGGKPVVPARPLNLQERSRNSNFAFRDGYCKTDGGCPMPKRRQPQQQQQQLDESDGKDSSEIGSHSVNV